MMKKTKIGFILITIFLLIVTPLAAAQNTTAITYGEATYNNQNYKQNVDNYFKSNSGKSLDNINQKIITASDVNKISQDISGKTYSSNQIVSCAYVDLSEKNNLNIEVDNKITTVTASMYKSALNSAGIKNGHVIITSPTSATGESALAGVMQAYETASGSEMPSVVKEAATKEIYTQTDIVNKTGADPDKIANLFVQVKQEVINQNITDKTEIQNIIIDNSKNININITQDQASEIADSILKTQSVQGQADDYQNKLSNITSQVQDSGIIDQIISIVKQIFGF
ncbi:MAG: DUF1002 domain-containing protein [Methanobacteriaceae archaeon]|nr:DUF1002 domain-containing protein [Methanobacteriaceae archaeon]